ncbi:major facilitator superfamily transporter [Pseudomassariella vexata]|uniref:Major facilitator superfamily transporter n=1 Tax=Pseudomassariella vexata TaxID=1141098 RepID=A0A1Y2E6S5_9PEZI|nr:major facilitator superfamily transporter [Pseudomassariella vexata]ORY67034.1 major facilitator superfamily transporter [Pseudomassariella vexata]
MNTSCALMDADSVEEAQAQADRNVRHGCHRSVPREVAVGALLGLLLLVNLAISLYQLPLNRVIERRLCREYYTQHNPSAIGREGNVAEELCKIDEVQQDLAWIQGVMETTWIVGDLVMTIPLGFMAEKYGQRTILWLNLVPRIFMLAWAVIVGYFEQSLPTKAFIAGPTLSILGGDCVFNSITYSLAAGITDDNVLRATYFGWMSSVSYVVALAGPALASASMTVLLWLPFWLGITLLLLAIPTILLLPSDSGVLNSSPSTSGDEDSHPLISSSILTAQSSDQTILRSISKRIEALRSILSSQPRNLNLLLIFFLLTSLASSDTKLLAQYISKRYHWPFASAGYLLSGKAVVNLTLLAVIIPRLIRARHASCRLNPQGESPDQVNIRYANLCLLMSVLGALAIALSAKVWLLVPSLFIYALGSALPVFTLSLLKSPAVTPKQDDRFGDTTDPETHIFSMVMMVKTIGSLFGAPLMVVLWMQGIGMGSASLGLPYFASAIGYVLATVVFSGVKVW